MFTGNRYYKRSELKKEKKLQEYTVMADTSLKKYDSRKHGRYEKLSYNGQTYLVKPRILGYTAGWIDTGEKRLIAVKKYGGLAALFLAVLTAGLVLMWNIAGGNDLADIPIIGEIIEDYMEDAPVQEYMTIPGLKEEYRISADNKEIYLINPEGNTVYFKYMLSIDGVTVYETDYIEPDRMARVDLYGLLDAGSYKVDVSVATIDIKTHQACNGAKLGTNVTVIKD